ncbi:UDP-N-acetylmuramate--L-alanine ligase [Clostridium sp. D2Q-11]|uniref:UDP-N-acetylmuramate--L-alanine ligase n=1 Tax=Anaeromonas frigoriresistens TaxID=2683708 RepID=A0A942UQV4_9FIRM|nr:UDP-N-acetylmuramate--L-alanine ligase [Anaeromonas frigoriresistens]MBS4537599.1 UDP-N-acetylmuramate--L-alanine ligase [Anaeromonas frigoriresistens]
MLNFNIDKSEYKNVHFIGIGGISMSGLAEILLNKGYKVTGSDMNDSKLIHKLNKKGANIRIGHEAQNVIGSDLVVYTSAINENNPEYKYAIDNNVPLMDRATFLGELMKAYKDSIAVAGTHGKTTTTGMIASILNHSELNSTILLGGELDSIGGNVKIGGTELLLTEACEYRGNFLKFYPTIGIILNIDEDHLDFFNGIDDIKDTFKKFIDIIPDSGYVIVNGEDENINSLIEKNKKNFITFGLANSNNYYANNIEYTDKGYPSYDLYINEDYIDRINLNVVGKHNIYNSLSAIASSNIAGVKIESIKSGLEIYKGTHRRFEDKGIIKGIQVVDDYAHHPTEIKATLESVGKKYNKVWCIFQPHTYTRTKSLLKEFSQSFTGADEVIVTDIYAAREKDTGLVHSKDLVTEIANNNINSKYIKTFEEVIDYLEKNVDKGDILITMGAGDVYKIGDMFKEKFIL